MRNSKDQSRQNLIDIINKRLDISAEAMPSGTLVSISGRNSVCFEGKVKILLYTPENIRLALGKETVSLVGKSLVCSAYHKRHLSVEGFISSVSFEED